MTVTNPVFAVAATLLGAIVGSFLNVVIYRLPRGTFFSDGARSICANPACRRPVPWHANLPVVGWVWLRGRARCCGFRLPVRYPLVEALTAALFALLWLFPPHGRHAWTGEALDGDNVLAFALYAFFAANLVANSFIDIDHRILPDVLTKSAIVVGLLGAALVPGLAGRFDIDGLPPQAESFVFSAAGAVFGFAVTQSIRLLARAVFRKDAMGFGDVKLMAAIGAFVGWDGVLLTFFLGSVLGAVVGVVHRWRTKDAYICFGPFLAVGALLALFAKDRIAEVLVALQDWQRAAAPAPWLTGAIGAVSLVLLVLLVRRGRAS